MYVDIGFNSDKFRFVFDQGLEEEVEKAWKPMITEGLSDKGVLYLDVFRSFISLKKKE